MSHANGSRSEPAAARPLVLALTSTPLLTDLLHDLLDETVIVRHFPAGGADLDGLVRHTRPDALVIDSHEDALELSAVAYELSVPLFQILLQWHEVRVFRDGDWDPVLPIESPTTIRNLLLGELFHPSTDRPDPLSVLSAQRKNGMEPSRTT